MTYLFLKRCLGGLLGLIAMGASAQAAVTKTELAGNPLSAYPHFEYVKVINQDAPVNVAIDPTRFPAIMGQTCDIYIVDAKTSAGWNANNVLTDVTGGAQTETFSGATIQANTFQVAAASTLNGDAGRGLGVGHDVVLDCNQNGLLDGDDYIDGRNNESGFYVVDDLTAPGPEAVTELDDAVAAGAFGMPAGFEAQNVFFPTNIETFTDPAVPGARVPLVVVSHGQGHDFNAYDHIGNHLASRGYIVISHPNNTNTGPVSASETTMRHTDAFLDRLGTINLVGGGTLAGRVDPDRIIWIGHSRGAEGVAIGYDSLFDGTYTPTLFDIDSIKLISSMLPTDFYGTDTANPHDANYHLWTASGDSDVNGSAGCQLCQTFHLHDRGTGNRASTVVQGTGHGWFHNGTGTAAFTNQCSIGRPNTHDILLSHLFVLVRRYVEEDIPSLDFMTRQYEGFRPMGVSTTDACIVVNHEYYDASANGNVIIDDYQTQLTTNMSSIGESVTFDVALVEENLLQDTDGTFVWSAADPFNGATQSGITGINGFANPAIRTDDSRGVVFEWNGSDRFYEWAIPIPERNFTSGGAFLDNRFLSFRGAQGTQHPNTLAVMGDVTFDVTLRDNLGVSSSINIGAYGGGGLEQPYIRGGGWHNEMETIRIRLNDFLTNGSGIDMSNIVALRLDLGPSHGSNEGRIVIDDVLITADRHVYDAGSNGDPHLRTVNGIRYDFQSAGEFTLLRDGDMEIQTRHTPVTTQGLIYNNHTDLNSCVSLNTAVAARVAGKRVSFQPGEGQTPSANGLELRVDGRLVDINSLGSFALGHRGRVSRAASGNGIEIEFPNGTILKASPHFWNSQQMWYLGLNVTNTPAAEGILGEISGGDWLPMGSDGSSFGGKPAAEAQRYERLYDKFSESWRVRNSNSLFDYGPGLSTNDFTVVGWPPLRAPCDIPKQPKRLKQIDQLKKAKQLTQVKQVRPPVKPINIAIAKKICASVEDKFFLQNCIDDVRVTGDESFAKAYQQVEIDQKRATRITLHADRDISHMSGKREFVAVVKNQFTGQALKAEKEQRFGSVQFMLNGEKYGKPVRLDGMGRASLKTSKMEPGRYKLSARFIPRRSRAAMYPSESFVLDHVVSKEKIKGQD